MYLSILRQRNAPSDAQTLAEYAVKRIIMRDCGGLLRIRLLMSYTQNSPGWNR